jgi:N-acetyl-gamma-glutamyl-phosphate reductase/acetylglutamate kinase
MSGYSGAGTVAGAQGVDGRPATVPKVSAESLEDGVRPYSLTDHIHEREAGVHLSDLLPSGADSMKSCFRTGCGAMVQRYHFGAEHAAQRTALRS